MSMSIPNLLLGVDMRSIKNICYPSREVLNQFDLCDLGETKST